MDHVLLVDATKAKTEMKASESILVSLFLLLLGARVIQLSNSQLAHL